ncbi:hypothetical protein KOE73_15715, partial [Acidomonas methanolica]|nr:hypothetical protein [Acidomonas methanolica]
SCFLHRLSPVDRPYFNSRAFQGARSIAALSASRRVPALIAMRDRMRAKGKAPKTILIAVARQLLVILNAMIQKGQPLQFT